MNFSDFNSTVFWLMLTCIGGFVGYQIKELVKSVQELNLKVAIILEKIEVHAERINEHTERLNKLEDLRHAHKMG